MQQVVVSDHQFPTRLGPVTPAEMRRRIRVGEVHAVDAVADLVLATSRAVFVHERVVVGHLFSVLPKAGIDPAVVTPEMLDMLATACRSAGAVVEVNERWRTPGVDVALTLCHLGVDLVPSSDAHDVSALGAWDHVASVAEAAHRLMPTWPRLPEPTRRAASPRAHASASSTPARLCASPSWPACASTTRAMVSTMSVKRIVPSWNASTHTSLAAL